MFPLMKLHTPVLVLCVMAFSVLVPGIFAEDASGERPKKRNVILVIGDGMGFGSLYAAADFATGSPTGFLFQQKDWTLVGCTTYSNNHPNGFDPSTIWNEFSTHFKSPTDSAASASSLNTGRKFTNGNVNKQPNGEVVETLAETAKKAGFSCGSVTTAGASHATPAGTAGHTRSRGNGHKIFHQMLFDGALDVIAGFCHPYYDASGQKQDTPTFHTYGACEEDWKRIQSGDFGEGWKYLDSREELHKIIAGEGEMPKKLLFFARSGVAYNFLKGDNWSGEKLVQAEGDEVPTLEELALGALTILNQNEKGFYLQVEEATVDGGNHNNDLPKAIRSIRMLNATVRAISEWVEKNSSWDETLLIVTADHDTGAFWGVGADQPETAFATPKWNGKEQLSTGQYYVTSHTNAPVPAYFRGREVDHLGEYIRGTDMKFGGFWGYDGRYIDNTDIYQIMRRTLGL